MAVRNTGNKKFVCEWKWHVFLTSKCLVHNDNNSKYNYISLAYYLFFVPPFKLLKVSQVCAYYWLTNSLFTMICLHIITISHISEYNNKIEVKISSKIKNLWPKFEYQNIICRHVMLIEFKVVQKMYHAK